MRSSSSRQARASMTPLPHRPWGSPPPITWGHSWPLAARTWAMAPARPSMPMESPAPSKAGPAAVEAQVSFPSCHRAISPLVPMSAKSMVPCPSHREEASRAVVTSPPTKAETQGGEDHLGLGAGHAPGRRRGGFPRTGGRGQRGRGREAPGLSPSAG